MSVNKRDRLLWFIRFIKRQKGPISKEKIDQAWAGMGFAENVIPVEKKGFPQKCMPNTTFHRYIKQAKDTYGINIVYTRDGWTIEETTGSRAEKSLLDSIDLFGSIHGNPELNKHIMLEDIPSGNINLEIIMQAILDRNEIEFNYYSFDEDAIPGISYWNFSQLKPYGLRLYGSRWYVIGGWGDDDVIDLYDMADHQAEFYDDLRMRRRLDKIEYLILPLDRMEKVEITSKTFEIPKDFDQEKLFADFVGPYADLDIPKQKIVVQAKGTTALYIESLPIHHSQKNIKEDKENRVIHFEYNLRPTHYFYKELLKHGAGVKVLSPENVKWEMGKLARKILANYE